MKKVFQQIVDKGKGDCMRAAIASLFESELCEVPNFITFDDIEETSANFELMKFMHNKGYDYAFIDQYYINGKGQKVEKYSLEFIKEIAKIDKGVNGYFYASVPSQTFTDVGHAVVVDVNLNIVHDPNPNQKALNLKPTDVKQILFCSDNWYIDIDGKLVEK